MGRIVAIRHVAFEDLGLFQAGLAARHSVTYSEAWNTDWAALAANPPDLLVVLGGPIGVYEPHLYPFLAAEIAAVGQHIAAGLPIVGICLGAQIMAVSQGARVFPAGVKEIGFAPLTLTAAGRASCLHPYTDEPDAFHWHGDTFDLPANATLLASTAAVTNQAFAIGDHAIGFQFHPEVRLAAIEDWLVGHAVELAHARIDIPAVRAAALAKSAAMNAKSQRVLRALMAQFKLEG